MSSIDNEYARASLPGEDWEERYGELNSRDDLAFFTHDAVEALPIRIYDVLWEIRARYPHCPTPSASEEAEPLIAAVDRFCIAYRDGKSWRELLHCAREVAREVKESCFWDGDFSCLKEDDGSEDW